MKPKELEQKLINYGYSVDRLVNSNGEHFGKYYGSYYAVCFGYPPCNPNRLGALTDKLHAVGGFESLDSLIVFLNTSFPEHKSANHDTKWVAPLD